ncbi:Ribulose bisphosphate carboxylase large chain [Rhizina undulata]
MTGGRSRGSPHGLTGKPLLYFTSIFVSLGVFLFGYDQGVMSGIITGPYFKDYFNQPTRAQIGTMVAILEVGAFISSLIVGRVGDIIGRRKTILYGAIIFVMGGALQTLASGMSSMILGRIIAGVGVGALSTIVPVYQSEISPPHNRGQLACIEFTGNIVGYASSVWVDYFCSYIDSDYSWRLPLFMQCAMGALLAAGSLVISESPRWLLDNDFDEEGIVVLANLHGGGDVHNERARAEFREIKESVMLERQEGERSYSEMWSRYRRRLLIAMSSQMFAQLNGINVISYYAPLVFEQAGWVGRDAILMTGINGIVYVLSTIPPWYLMDQWGRRPILLSGAIVMSLALSAISYFIFIDVHYTPTLVVIFVVIYNAFFGYSWGPVPWLYPPEIMPLSIRAKGASLSTATNWAFNWLVGEMTPVLQDWIKWRLYLVHAFFCAVSFVVVYFAYPETKGVQLEEMDAIFGDQNITPPPSTIHQALRHRHPNRSESPVPSLDINHADVDVRKTGSSTRYRKQDGNVFGGWFKGFFGGKSHSGGSGGHYRRLDEGDDV